MNPTSELRWIHRGSVKRDRQPRWYNLFLQQKWIGSDPAKNAHRYERSAGVIEEWRDVPIIEEG